jgi:hypothetical protein
VEIEIVPAGKSDPRRLAEAALKERKKRRKDAKDRKLGFAKAPDFDDSSPCFEYWLLLHLTYTTAPMPKFADVKPRLRAELGGAYEKNCKDSAVLIPPLLAYLETAMTNAQRARQHHASAATPSK